MATYKHGIYVDEVATKVPSPVVGTSGIQVVFGTAPINLATDPTAVTNVPIECDSWEDAVSKLGFSKDFTSYTLCQSMYASFKIAKVAPVVFVNVLDPSTHKKTNAESTVTVTNKLATYKVLGVLLSSVVVKSGASALTLTTDYTLSFDDDGYVVIALTSTGAGKSATSLTVTSTSIDPTMVKSTDVIGGTDGDGKRTGMALVKDVYPLTQLIPGTLIAPGWGADSTVGTALAAKCEAINGVFRAYACIDLDCTSAGATKYSDVSTIKTAAGFTDTDCSVLWPMVIAGTDGYTFSLSAIYAAGMQALDAANGDVPCRAPSNVNMGITGAVLADGTEINLDFEDAAVINGAGVVTAIRAEGWKVWGVETAAYPDNTDPKDHFVGIRRMFSWQANSFIKRYISRLDENISYLSIKNLITDENIHLNSLAAQNKIAGGSMEFRESENPLANILAGKVTFHEYFTPYPTEKEISDTLEYDADILAAVLTGGAN